MLDDVRKEFPLGSRVYNFPGCDVEAASEAILLDVGLGATHPLDRARFWDEGRWVGGHEWHERERGREPFAEAAGALPRRETFAALEELRNVFGGEVRYLSRGIDIGITIPSKARGATVEEALLIVRQNLPNSAVGLDATLKLIVVADALQGDQNDRHAAVARRADGPALGG